MGWQGQSQFGQKLKAAKLAAGPMNCLIPLLIRTWNPSRIKEKDMGQVNQMSFFIFSILPFLMQ
jgi:hypothetical protein